MNDITKFIGEIRPLIHSTAISTGWWNEPRHLPELICLAHSEISEAYEAKKRGKVYDNYIPEHEALYVELGDCIIRICDFCEHFCFKFETFVLATPSHSSTIEVLMELHYSLSQALEVFRRDNGMELVFWLQRVIEIAFSEFDNEKLKAAILAKMEYNKTRPFKHGKKL